VRSALGQGDVVFLHTGGWPALFAYPEAFPG
jgi:1-aminocyclopropane-1-carboxylate deaminase/D-cysteine desulfhydrase-like pyridoxal-dependent ACC family enzyme